MEITINLPDKVFANVASLAAKTDRRVDEIIVEKLEENFLIEIKDLEKSIEICSNEEIVKLTKLQLPEKKDKRLSFLLQKQNKEKITSVEQKELWKLMDLNRFTTLKKAFALREVSKRGLNGED